MIGGQTYLDNLKAFLQKANVEGAQTFEDLKKKVQDEEQSDGSEGSLNEI